MYILKNAWRNVVRNRGRNILIGVIILVIGVAATIALAINNTANNLIASYKDSFDKEATISFDRETMMQDFDFSNRDNFEEMENNFAAIETYTVADLKNFADSDLITGYYYTYNISLDGENLEKVESDIEIPGGGGKMPGGLGGGGGDRNSSAMDFTLNGYSSLESMSEFIDGLYTISEIEDDAWDKAFSGDYVFINEELAEYNSLSLGDTITLADEAGNTYDFEIIGIFTDNETGSEMQMFSNSANTLITNADALVAITDENSDLAGTLTPTFLIEDYGVVEALSEEFREKGLGGNYILTTNESEADANLSSLESTQGFALTFLIIVLLIGGVVLVILNLINIRERKYEIGVLRTIGMSKNKLTFQFMLELGIVTFFALALGICIGSVSSPAVSNSLLASEIESSSSRTDDMMSNFGGRGNMGGQPGDSMPSMPNFDQIGGAPTIEAYDSIDAVVDLAVIFELFGIGLVLVVISSLAALISIQKFSPLTILKERS